MPKIFFANSPGLYIWPFLHLALNSMYGEHTWQINFHADRGACHNLGDDHMRMQHQADTCEAKKS